MIKKLPRYQAPLYDEFKSQYADLLRLVRAIAAQRVQCYPREHQQLTSAPRELGKPWLLVLVSVDACLGNCTTVTANFLKAWGKEF